MTDETGAAETVAAGSGETRASEPSPVVRAGRRATILPAGTRVGRYELVDKLGAGGMGVVYRARDPRLDRDVAVKLVLASGDVAAAQERLEREAQAMAKLSHPNVAIVHDIGAYGDQLFVAMELCPGGSLARWLRTPRPWREVVRRFIAAGRGLAAAHQLGLVHRDFKPDNVLIGHDDAIKVSDFGLVTSSRELALGSGSGSIEGTPAYMAPEQLEGGELDARADQFAFAVSLWEGVCGGRPFQPEAGADDPVVDGMLRAIRARRRMRASSIDVPARVLRVLERALEPAPVDRWPSLDAMLAALERAARPRWPRWVAATTLVAMVAAAVAIVPRLSRPGYDLTIPLRLAKLGGPLVAGAGDLAWTTDRELVAEQAYDLAHRLTGSPLYLLVTGMRYHQLAVDAFIAHREYYVVNHACASALAAYDKLADELRAAQFYAQLEQFRAWCIEDVDRVADPDELDELANELWRAGDHVRAFKALEKALDVSDEPRFLRRLGDFDVEDGECDAAKFAYGEYEKRAPQIQPTIRAQLHRELAGCQRR